MHICGYGYDRGHLWCQIAGRDRYAARCEVVRGRTGSPLGVRLTWGDDLGGVGVFSSHRHCSMYGYALWVPRLCMSSPFDACSGFYCFGLWNG